MQVDAVGGRAEFEDSRVSVGETDSISNLFFVLCDATDNFKIVRVDVLQTRLNGALQRITDLQHNEEVVSSKFSVVIKSIEDLRLNKASSAQEDSTNKLNSQRVRELEQQLAATVAEVAV